MPRKTKTTAVADKAAQPQFPADLLEQLTPGPVTPTELEGWRRLPAGLGCQAVAQIPIAFAP